MQHLIERLEKATGSDRELDNFIVAAIGWKRIQTGSAAWPHFVWRTPDGAQFPDDGTRVPNYTGSIDAASTLVPNGLTWNAGITDEHFGGPIVATAQVLTREFTPKGWRSRGATPAIALCIAALSASMALTETPLKSQQSA